MLLLLPLQLTFMIQIMTQCRTQHFLITLTDTIPVMTMMIIPLAPILREAETISPSDPLAPHDRDRRRGQAHVEDPYKVIHELVVPPP